MQNNDELFKAICDGEIEDVTSSINLKLNENVSPLSILNNNMIPAMKEIGAMYSRNEIFLPEMLYSAKAMQYGIKVLEPYLIKEGYKPKAKLAIGTVEGDLHDIGKNIVAVMLKGAGYDVVDLGVDCSLEKYISAVKDGAQVLLCSALLTTTMARMKEVVNYCRENHPDVKIVLGGAPVSKQFADEIKADAYGEDASEAAEIIDSFFA